MSLLIIDEGPLLRRAVHHAFEGKYKTHTAELIDDAIDILEQRIAIDVIMIEETIINHQGIESLMPLLQHTDDTIRSIPIMIVGGPALDDDDKKLLKQFNVNWLTKPFDSMLIKTRINNLISGESNDDTVYSVTQTGIRHGTNIDHETGFLTREYFLEYGSNILAECHQYQNEVCFLLFSIDNHEHNLLTPYSTEYRNAYQQLLTLISKVVPKGVRIVKINKNVYGFLLPKKDILSAKEVGKRLFRIARKQQIPRDAKSFSISAGLSSVKLDNVSNLVELETLTLNRLFRAQNKGGGLIVVTSARKKESTAVRGATQIQAQKASALNMNDLLAQINSNPSVPVDPKQLVRILHHIKPVLQKAHADLGINTEDLVFSIENLSLQEKKLKTV